MILIRRKKYIGQYESNESGELVHNVEIHDCYCDGRAEVLGHRVHTIRHRMSEYDY